jgi:hypothetical protein
VAQIFISFAQKDRPIAEVIERQLERSGLRVFNPARDVRPGEPFDQSVLSALTTADTLLVLWSKHSAQSAHAEKEVRSALKAWSQDRLLLATLDGTPLPAGLRDQVAVRFQDQAPGRPLSEAIAAFADNIVRQIHQLAEASDSQSPPSASVGASGSAPAAASKGGAGITGKTLALFGLGVLLAAVAGGAVFWLGLGHAPAPPPSPGPDVRTGFDGVWLVIALLALGLLALFALVKFLRRPKAEIARRTPGKPAASAAPVAPKDLFVSYSWKDMETVDRVVRRLENEGIGVWIDRSARDGRGQRYAAPIVKAIRASKAVAVMCSKNAFESDHVVREIYVAGDFKKPFLSVQLDPSDVPDELRYFLTGYPRLAERDIETRDVKQIISGLFA